MLAWFGIGQLALSGAAAIERDGLARGRRAPAWTLADAAGQAHSSPPAAASLQLILFADHSLRAFPSVVDGLQELSQPGDLEIVILTRGASEGAAELAWQLGLDGITVLAGSPKLYGDYNVRVMPFASFVDQAGLVRASSLVNHDWQLVKLRQVAGMPPAADQDAELPRPAFRLAV